MTAFLEMRGIQKSFPGVKALDGVDLSVREGSIHAICGENGAGKSTLMNILSGVYPAGSYEGEIRLNGRPVRFRGIRESEQAGIAIIHQELALVPELSILENLFLGCEVATGGILNWPRARTRARDLLAQVGLAADPDTTVRHLGVGQQQLVEIAKALGKNARLLILDEPTAALPETDAAHLLALLRELRTQGMTCVLISHKLVEVLEIAEAVTILRDGRTVETLARAEGGVDEERIIRGMVGRPLPTLFPRRKGCPGEQLLEVRDWTVRHPQVQERRICKGISFCIHRGEIVGLAGLMGAGRTALARSIFGRSFGLFERGTLLKDGRELELRTVTEAIRAGIAYVPEDRKALGLNLLDDIQTTVVSAGLDRIARRGILDHGRAYAAAEGFCRALGIKAPTVQARVDTLSGGTQQKVVLAKWLFLEPDLLILDEPTRGIDVGAKSEIYALIQDLAERGKGVLLISSELPELLGLSDRIFTLCAGALTGV